MSNPPKNTAKSQFPYKLLFGFFTIVIVAAFAWFAIQKDWLPNPAKWFSAQPVLIDQTPLVITGIKQLAELHTAQLYAEIVVDSTEYPKTSATTLALRNLLHLPNVGSIRKLVLVVKGKVKAGVQLLGWNEDQIIVHKDSVWIQLPPPVLLDIITNPADIEIFQEEGKWTDEGIIAVKMLARKKLEATAIEKGLLKMAGDKAVTTISQFLKTAGFKFIAVTYKK